ncbi:hypothetical protein RJ641_024026 [Dillenia turbinata]|uniref:Uncharacterized protein n=1 Tax=Dillenia turbinata TaxID=194707 RepID=A0AAN8U7X6_9MAGN
MAAISHMGIVEKSPTVVAGNPRWLKAEIGVIRFLTILRKIVRNIIFLIRGLVHVPDPVLAHVVVFIVSSEESTYDCEEYQD